MTCLILGAACAAGPMTPEPRPDLGVAYISLTPRYPAFTVAEADHLPVAVSPASTQPLAAEELKKVQRWPRSGETVTAVARVVNHGSAPSGPFRYTWSLNGKTVGQGEHPGLAPNCEATSRSREWRVGELTLRESELAEGTFADLSLPVQWKSKGQRLRLEVRLDTPGAKEQEPTTESDNGLQRDNNAREERTDSLAFLVTVPRSAYNAWSRLPGRSGGFEDWIQGQFELLRARFQISAYPEAPQGVEQPIRIDTIRVLEDGQEPAVLEPVVAAAGWDGVWSYPAARNPAEEAAAPAEAPDEALFRHLLRQMGIVDLSVLSVAPENVRTASGRPVLAGFLHPSLLAVRGAPLAEHTVLALNRMTGRRRGFRGTYLFDLPRACRLRVLDNNGRPLPDASIRVFQKQETQVGPEPVVTGRTSPAGELPLPDRPVPPFETADGFALRENPFGALRASGENGLLLIEVTSGGRTEHHWLPVSAANVAYWHRQTRQATFDLRTRFPGPVAPAAPVGLQATRRPSMLLDRIDLTWRAPAGEEVGGYLIYRASHPTYAWERVGAVTSFQTRYADPFLVEHPVRYAVSSVDLNGDESALSEVVVGP